MRWALLVSALMLALLPEALAVKKGSENVHRADADCARCHTAERGALESDRAAARTLLAADLEDRCYACHSDEGPSHHTGMRPKKPVPDILPLSPQGLITCATCHFIHGEKNPFGQFVRVDNTRGGLCLTCHELSELQ